jgi:hypothetical protein
MNQLEGPLNRLIAAAREPATPQAVPSAPPWFARSVVNRWLAKPAGAPAQSWLSVSRGALACATLIMAVSLAFNFRVVWRRDVPEQIASDSVVSLFLPK